jgi:hypothetical protein
MFCFSNSFHFTYQFLVLFILLVKIYLPVLKIFTIGITFQRKNMIVSQIYSLAAFVYKTVCCLKHPYRSSAN